MHVTPVLPFRRDQSCTDIIPLYNSMKKEAFSDSSDVSFIDTHSKNRHTHEPIIKSELYRKVCITSSAQYALIDFLVFFMTPQDEDEDEDEDEEHEAPCTSTRNKKV